MQGAFDSALLLEKLANLVRELGHYPVVAEMNMKRRNDSSFPTSKTFQRIGRKGDVAAELVGWCGNSSEWNDVSAIASKLAAPDVKPEDSGNTVEEMEHGYVYLMKSGKYFKIGRSNSPGRREYELAIQLPEPVTTVHTIETDDPSGIERYWHERFSERRKNGEWFELNKNDVSAFRRRKFM